ncbi:MAG: 16S rRNA (guanine(527)-N(7))-methyltransferase RsmG [Sideroxyarcus sp.]|nr:16S rRNA (guanine(527)-N(7))-methyltransferase RsmG [Sideroxyarcus sp.]
MSAEAKLRAGLTEIGLELDRGAQQKMLAYLALMRKWNKTYNLTAISDENEMVIHHLLDSLAVLPHLWGGKWLDVGCGAGVPGAILAIARPEWGFTLLDSNSKKTSFVQQAAIELDISNIEVHTGRVEDWGTADRFDGIISRAFAELGRFTQLTKHLLAEGGRWAAMKGRLEDELPQGCKVLQRIPIHVPGLNAVRSLVIAAKIRE